MPRLILTPEQTELLATATGAVEVVNSFGHTIGQFTASNPAETETHVLTPELLAEIQRIDKAAKPVATAKALNAHENA